MLRNKLVRSDGSIIDSSVIISCEFTEEVNSNTNLTVGDTTASELTVEILAPASIQQDEVLTYYIIEDGVETKIGVFNAEKPTAATRTSVRFSAYDNLAKTETRFSDWLRENQSMFPMTLGDLVGHACSQCGVTLASTSFPHTDLLVNAFYADDITCRQVLSWAAAVAGRFVRANVDGALEFAWYEDATHITVQPYKGLSGGNDNAADLTLVDDGEGNLSITSDELELTDDGEGNVAIKSKLLTVTDYGAGDIALAVKSPSPGVACPYMQGSLTYENFTTDRITRVRINHSEDDIGVTYPVEADGNCFIISENTILGAMDSVTVTQVATDLYDQLKAVTYVPFSVTVPRTIKIRTGDIINIVDRDGNSFESYVMKISITASGTSISASGDKSYGSNAAVSSEKYSNLTGKVLNISKSIDGLSVQAKDLDGKFASLELSTEEFKTYVKDAFVTEDDFGTYRTAISSEFKQTADSITQTFEHVQSNVDEATKDIEELGKDVESLDQSLSEVTAHIKSGVLDHNDDGTPVYGVEVGQRTEVGGVETFNKYARFTSDRLSFFDKGGNEVAHIGDRTMFISQAEVTERFKHGGFVDITLEDGSIISKWVGGVS